MVLTRDFKETIQARAERDPAFRRELLKEGVQCLLSGEVDTGKTVLRDYINATVGFEELGALTHKSPKSLMRMFGPKGNPQARNLFEIIGHLHCRLNTPCSTITAPARGAPSRTPLLRTAHSREPSFWTGAA